MNRKALKGAVKMNFSLFKPPNLSSPYSECVAKVLLVVLISWILACFAVLISSCDSKPNSIYEESESVAHEMLV